MISGWSSTVPGRNAFVEPELTGKQVVPGIVAMVLCVTDGDFLKWKMRFKGVIRKSGHFLDTCRPNTAMSVRTQYMSRI